MNEQEQDWYLDLKDRIEEAKKEQEQTGTDYRFCDPDLLQYSLKGLSSIPIYD